MLYVTVILNAVTERLHKRMTKLKRRLDELEIITGEF
jgi:hypothetical protein